LLLSSGSGKRASDPMSRFKDRGKRPSDRFERPEWIDTARRAFIESAGAPGPVLIHSNGTELR